ncbi:winged helix DNA-binding protein [Isoptericola jiangsuensis]|uniref:Winged helix DNA-binding protein n=1 Tax=Isoptericola jiangsuensis TaxID=548579 RepID=A0A2A9F338_9MICO|nr:winged helix DNA-binding domain-containing protein [Isoptericola jiangsuensis]PFG44839.1 winged helix DNA-binding protein [Isoptericola jiangsuensis]
MSVDAARVLAARLHAQRLRDPDLPEVAGAVRYLLAVQGQELRPTLHGLDRRLAPARRGGPDLAVLDDGRVLRTHVLRPTWHLVARDDVRWLLELTAPRVGRVMASTERSWGLGSPEPAIGALLDLLAAGPRTRDDLAAALVARGVLAPDAPGIVLTHVLMHAELRRLVVSGPPADGRHTYALFDDRVPPGYGPLGATFDRPSAVLELWRRYLPGRAYATVKDLAQWSGLTLTELRAGLAVLLDVGEVVEVPGADGLDGLTLVTTSAVAGQDRRAADGAPVADLLCAYDEIVCSYGESRHVLADPRAPEPDRTGAFLHTLLLDGRRAARWRWPARLPDDGPLVLDVQWQRDPTPAERVALADATADLTAHLRRRVAG